MRPKGTYCSHDSYILRRRSHFKRDIITPLVGVPVGELTEEEQLALALKSSKDMALEEQVASFIYDRAPSTLPLFFTLSSFFYT